MVPTLFLVAFGCAGFILLQVFVFPHDDSMQLRRRLDALLDPRTVTAKPQHVHPAAQESVGINGFQCPPARTIRVEKHSSFANFINDTMLALTHASYEVTGDQRPLHMLAANFDKFVTVPGGFWAEFGVFMGGTLVMASQVLPRQSSFTGVISGFDSFEGLPEDWRKNFEAGSFGTGDSNALYNRARSKLPPYVELYKGWFQDTVPSFLDKHPSKAAALVHHDGDLFVSTAITLQLLDERIVPGTHMVFDELVGYPGYENHEIFSLWLWMKQRRDVTLCAMGHSGPIDINDPNWLKPKNDFPPKTQSAWFQVMDSAAVVMRAFPFPTSHESEQVAL